MAGKKAPGKTSLEKWLAESQEEAARIFGNHPIPAAVTQIGWAQKGYRPAKKPVFPRRRCARPYRGRYDV
jgi:hypothetical protein